MFKKQLLIVMIVLTNYSLQATTYAQEMVNRADFQELVEIANYLPTSLQVVAPNTTVSSINDSYQSLQDKINFNTLQRQKTTDYSSYQKFGNTITNLQAQQKNLQQQLAAYLNSLDNETLQRAETTYNYHHRKPQPQTPIRQRN